MDTLRCAATCVAAVLLSSLASGADCWCYLVRAIRAVLLVPFGGAAPLVGLSPSGSPAGVCTATVFECGMSFCTTRIKESGAPSQHQVQKTLPGITYTVPVLKKDHGRIGGLEASNPAAFGSIVADPTCRPYRPNLDAKLQL